MQPIKEFIPLPPTNAHYLTDANAKKTVESGLDRLIISIDGTTQTYIRSTVAATWIK